MRSWSTHTHMHTHTHTCTHTLSFVPLTPFLQILRWTVWIGAETLQVVCNMKIWLKWFTHDKTLTKTDGQQHEQDFQVQHAVYKTSATNYTCCILTVGPSRCVSASRGREEESVGSVGLLRGLITWWGLQMSPKGGNRNVFCCCTIKHICKFGNLSWRTSGLSHCTAYSSLTTQLKR